VCAIFLSNTQWIDDHPILLSQKIWMDGWMGGVTRQVQYFFDDAQGLSLVKNLAQGKTKDISHSPSIYPSQGNHPASLMYEKPDVKD
jgi:hypothetical protein